MLTSITSVFINYRRNQIQRNAIFCPKHIRCLERLKNWKNFCFQSRIHIGNVSFDRRFFTHVMKLPEYTFVVRIGWYLPLIIQCFNRLFLAIISVENRFCLTYRRYGQMLRQHQCTWCIYQTLSWIAHEVWNVCNFDCKTNDMECIILYSFSSRAKMFVYRPISAQFQFHIYY